MVSEHNRFKVGDYDIWLFGRWVWDVGIREDLLSEEDYVLLSQLYSLLQDVQIDPWQDDRFIWWRSIGGFSVSFNYCRLLAVELSESVLEAEKLRLLEYLWKTNAPSKALIFGWQMVLRRLSLREELAKRHIIVGTHSIVCPFCFLLKESLDHIFLICPLSNRIWVEACGWISAGAPSCSASLANSFMAFIDVVGTTPRRRTLWFFGLFICWVIWSCGNTIIFKGGILARGMFGVSS
ncbi:hypothetical protein KIW84_074275 [Lathyrus oleraceus]|uniref:Reverse transcriptase zinc-binding domain-containing protein n=1 Tax=Pisum sativum TaxID=3888 RepID=A0A9D4ZZQ0_PEA|nr:hypothetical protein KIW84_074275 [Pisum sativum]